MNKHAYNSTEPLWEQETLQTADAVARAAHLWIHSLWQDDSRPSEERRALAGGLVSGLCDHLELSPRVREVVAYVYSLIDDEGDEALELSRTMLAAGTTPSLHFAYQKGRSEAGGILEMLAYHEKSH